MTTPAEIEKSNRMNRINRMAYVFLLTMGGLYFLTAVYFVNCIPGKRWEPFGIVAALALSIAALFKSDIKP